MFQSIGPAPGGVTRGSESRGPLGLSQIRERGRETGVPGVDLGGFRGVPSPVLSVDMSRSPIDSGSGPSSWSSSSRPRPPHLRPGWRATTCGGTGGGTSTDPCSCSLYRVEEPSLSDRALRGQVRSQEWTSFPTPPTLFARHRTPLVTPLRPVLVLRVPVVPGVLSVLRLPDAVHLHRTSPLLVTRG